MSSGSSASLNPAQVCFVVDDVKAAVKESVARFGWGPFFEFSAPVDEAHYHGWTGPKKTDVALGMAGRVQVELIHVHEGHDAVEAYQAKYGAGFQHLGIQCRNREAAAEALIALGGRLDDQGEFPGIRFAFVDTPTGPGMFELLQPEGNPSAVPGAKVEKERPKQAPPKVTIDRATIATPDLDAALAFYAKAFDWSGVVPETQTLRCGGQESKLRRVQAQAGKLLLELIEPRPGAGDPYALHLERRDHGLVHAGGEVVSSDMSETPTIEGQWLESGESFGLFDWSGGAGTLQLRAASA